MTTTDKPVQRRTRAVYNILYSGRHNARPVVVKIAAGDVLEFRELGRRRRWLLAVDTAFKYAVRLQALPRPERERQDDELRQVWKVLAAGAGVV